MVTRLQAPKPTVITRRIRQRGQTALSLCVALRALVGSTIAAVGAALASGAEPNESTYDAPFSILAGNGSFGPCGSGGPANEAALAKPWYLADDGRGGVYVSSRASHLVHNVDPDGTIDVAVGGWVKDAGDVVRGSRTDCSVGTSIPAEDLRLINPEGISLDADAHLVIADSGNHCVRRYDPAPATHILFQGGIQTGADNSRAGQFRLAAADASILLAFDDMGKKASR